MNYLECASKIDALCSGSPLTRIEYNLDEDNAVSIIQTPYEFGATNWFLVLLFHKNRLTGIGIRSADSLRYLVSGGPPDKVDPDSEIEWKNHFR